MAHATNATTGLVDHLLQISAQLASTGATAHTEETLLRPLLEERCVRDRHGRRVIVWISDEVAGSVYQAKSIGRAFLHPHGNQSYTHTK